MKAFGGGNLTAQYQKALGYVLGVKDIDSVMIGFSEQKRWTRRSPFWKEKCRQAMFGHFAKENVDRRR